MPSPPERTSDRLSIPWSSSDRLVPRTLVQPLQQFLNTEVAGGVLLLIAAIAALTWANSPWSAAYDQLWHTEIGFQIGDVELQEDLRHWVNDLAMALFFFVVGLEIKRERVHGELRDPRTAALPVACALGGMVVPAALFAAFNAGGAGSAGWGIPMATDIAFALGVLALVGRRTPASLKVFLLTLAIVDDIGAIVVIAIFYSDGVFPGWLLGAGAGVATMYILDRNGVRSSVPYVVLAGAVWLMTYWSGVHPTIAGVLLGVLTPTHAFHPPAAVRAAVAERLERAHLADESADEQDEVALLEAASLTREAISPLTRLEAVLHPWSSYVVLPIFALANAGIELSSDGISDAAGSAVTLGVIIGLVIGKPLGIVLAAWISVRMFNANLPAAAGWLELAGVGAIAGIGFTVSIFIADLAFTGGLAVEAKMGILAASLLAGVVGAIVLLLRSTSDPLDSGT
jgi:Na+:H+ antiporter, NhaA family